MNRLRGHPNDRGFTLIELLVVVIIIGILAAIAVPVFLNQKAKAYDATVKADLKHLTAAAELYYIDHNSYPSDASGWAGATPPTATTAIRAFTAAAPVAGYVIYGSAGPGMTIWVLSSWTGGVPTRSGLTVLPDTPPAAGTLGVPTGATWATWTQVGGADWGSGTVQRDTLTWFDPSLLLSSKFGTDYTSLGGFDGHIDGTTSIETPWSTVDVVDAPVAGRAARFVTGPSSSDWGVQMSPWGYAATPPAGSLIVAGQTYTASVWLKAPLGTPLNATFRVQKPDWSWVATAASKPVVASGSWQRVTATVTATAPWAGQTFAITVRTLRGGAAPAGTLVLVTAPQIDKGPTATPFQAQ